MRTQTKGDERTKKEQQATLQARHQKMTDTRNSPPKKKSVLSRVNLPEDTGVSAGPSSLRSQRKSENS